MRTRMNNHFRLSMTKLHHGQRRGFVSPTKTISLTSQSDPSPWPLNFNDVTPLEWWRTMPADRFTDAKANILCNTLTSISVASEPNWLAALDDNGPTSVAIAISAMPIDKISLSVDLALSALLLTALRGNAAARFVLSHILRRAPLNHPFGENLAASWRTSSTAPARGRRLIKGGLSDIGSHSRNPGLIRDRVRQ